MFWESRGNKEKREQDGKTLEREVMYQKTWSVERVIEGHIIVQRELGRRGETKKRVEDFHESHLKLTVLRECKVCQKENTTLEETKRIL